MSKIVCLNFKILLVSPLRKKKAHTPPSKELWELPHEIHSNIHQPFHVGPKFNGCFLWLIHHVSYFKLIDLDGLGFVILPPDQISEELLREKTQLRNCSRSNRLDVVQRRKCFLLWRQLGKYRKKSLRLEVVGIQFLLEFQKGETEPTSTSSWNVSIWMFPKNNGTPKSSILIGFSTINHPFWGKTPYFWKHPYTALHSRSWSPGNPHTSSHPTLGCACTCCLDLTTTRRRLRHDMVI